MKISDEKIEQYDLQPYEAEQSPDGGDSSGAGLKTYMYSFRVNQPAARFHYVVVARDDAGRICGIADGLRALGLNQLSASRFPWNQALPYRGLIHCRGTAASIEVRARSLDFPADF